VPASWKWFVEQGHVGLLGFPRRKVVRNQTRTTISRAMEARKATDSEDLSPIGFPAPGGQSLRAKTPETIAIPRTHRFENALLLQIDDQQPEQFKPGSRMNRMSEVTAWNFRVVKQGFLKKPKPLPWQLVEPIKGAKLAMTEAKSCFRLHPCNGHECIGQHHNASSPSRSSTFPFGGSTLIQITAGWFLLQLIPWGRAESFYAPQFQRHDRSSCQISTG